ncbi:hypothetical protein [Clostridium sp.]|uniref:hypothetical protein n=1 Tax=Clostridium sp. TaxID=1506 RepID=UPI002FCA9A65
MELSILIKEINKQSNIKINKGYYHKLTVDTIARIEELEDYITKELNIDEYNEVMVKEKLKLQSMSNKLLIDKLEESENVIYEKLLELRRLNFKEQSLDGVKKNMMEQCIRPTYSINSGNMITLSKPTLNSLTFDEIKLLTGFESYKSFNSIENLYDFLIRYESLIQKEKEMSSYLIKGLTLYCNFEYICEDDIIQKFSYRYMKQEMYRIDKSNPATLRASLMKIRDECICITGKNYKLFEEIYDKYKGDIELTKQLIEEGMLKERYYSFFSPDSCIYEEDRLKVLEEDMRIKEGIRTRLNGLIVELNLIKEQINNQRCTDCSSKNQHKDIYSINETIENLKKRGFSEEHIEVQVKKLEGWNRVISENRNKNHYVLLHDDCSGEIVSDFLFAGKGKVLVIRVICSKNNYGDFAYTLCMENSPVIIVKKGSLHRKLNIQYSDGTVEEVVSKSKIENIRNAMIRIVNRIL